MTIRARQVATLCEFAALVERSSAPHIFTILIWKASEDSFLRVLSTHDGVSPAGQTKTSSVSEGWRKTVLERGEVFATDEADVILDSYGEGDDLVSSGCTVAANIPVPVGSGNDIAVLNFFWKGGQRQELIDAVLPLVEAQRPSLGILLDTEFGAGQ